MNFTELEVREMRRRLGQGVPGSRASGSYGATPHGHNVTEIVDGASLIAGNVFTGAVNQFDRILATGDIATDDRVFIAEAEISPDNLTGVVVLTLPDRSGELAVTSDIPAGVSDGDKGDIVVTGSGATWSIDSAVATAAGRALMDDASAADQRTTLGLGTIATVADAPSDGSTYGRNNGAWAVAGGGSGLTQPQVMARCMGC